MTAQTGGPRPGGQRKAPARTGTGVTIRAGLRRTSMFVAVLILALAVLLAWLAARVTTDADRDLLDRQVAQAATVLGNAVGILEAQLADAGQVAIATEAAPGPFQRFAAARVTGSESLASLSLLRVADGEADLLATEGEDPLLPDGGLASPLFTGLPTNGDLAVAGILPGEPSRLGYALVPAGDTSGLVVYAETLLNPGPQGQAPEDAAFGGLDFAVYLGEEPDPAQLILSTAPLPIRGDTETATTSFGDTVLTVVGAARAPLTGTLAAALPWIVVGVGVALAVAGAAIVEILSRRRAVAEQLAAENERLYHQQRGIAGTLQHAMLPDVPHIDGIEAVARYVAGVDELDVGGDWYDVIPRAPGCCVFVVGDIAGRGLPAATTMAALRFALRAYLAQGDDIGAVVAKLHALLDVSADHQFATLLIGELDATAGRLRLVSAGHFPPLLISKGRAEHLPCPVGVPVGVAGVESPPVAELRLPASGTLLAFTDGLVERRGEVIDAGLQRLRDAAFGRDGQPLEPLVAEVMQAMTTGGGKDDTVLLGLRWARQAEAR